MDLGVFYPSLVVKDITKSKAFYEKLGFSMIPNGGSVKEKWLVMSNGDIKIGLFESMFPKNTLTFHPKDAREIHSTIKDTIDIEYMGEGMKATKGPCSFVINDPDGNPILFDQYE
ncbi:VOC family protein [Roseivirga sp. BDSF3-8]|uniref:VOC family protein n=1 Tax=Roseivirga sp. BDSF3-8 TaxID=3241598 RepID=UPI0035322B17